MMTRKKHVEPIPEEFASYEEEAEFWDTHDTTDYPDAFRTVEFETEFRDRYIELLGRMYTFSNPIEVKEFLLTHDYLINPFLKLINI